MTMGALQSARCRGDFSGCWRGPSSMTAAASALRGVSFFIVAQQSAGRFVDEMDSGAGRAGHGFVAIGMIGRRKVRHLNLNIHASPRATKDQFAHFFYLSPKTWLRIDLAQGREAAARMALH
jgi:hypothetical protein